MLLTCKWAKFMATQNTFSTFSEIIQLKKYKVKHVITLCSGTKARHQKHQMEHTHADGGSNHEYWCYLHMQPPNNSPVGLLFRRLVKFSGGGAIVQISTLKKGFPTKTAPIHKMTFFKTFLLKVAGLFFGGKWYSRKSFQFVCPAGGSAMNTIFIKFLNKWKK